MVETVFNKPVATSVSKPRASSILISLPYGELPAITVQLELIVSGGTTPLHQWHDTLSGPFQAGRVIPRFGADMQPVPGQSLATNQLMADVASYVYHLAAEKSGDPGYAALVKSLNPDE